MDALGKFPEQSRVRVRLLHELATVRQQMGRNAEVEELYEQVVAIKRTTLGEAHPSTAVTQHDLAYFHDTMGRDAEAEAFYEQALGIARTAFGETHLNYARTLHEIAGMRWRMRRHADAQKLYEQVLGITKTTLGDAHPDYAATLHELAGVLQSTGRNVEAESLYELVLDIAKASLGEAHPQTILSLAGCRASLEHVDAAREMFESALARAESLSDSAVFWTGRVRLKCAQGFLGAGLREEAKGEALAARDLLVEALGPEAALVQEAATLIEDSGAGH